MKKLLTILFAVLTLASWSSTVLAEDFDFEKFKTYMATLKKSDMKYSKVIIDKFTIADTDKVDRDHNPDEMLKMAEVTAAEILEKSKLFDSVNLRGEKKDLNETALILNAQLVDLRVVSTTKRLFLGAFAGSSGMEIKASLVDGKAQQVAEKNVRDEANAFSGAWTVGASDRNISINVGEQLAAFVIENAQTKKQ